MNDFQETISLIEKLRNNLKGKVWDTCVPILTYGTEMMTVTERSATKDKNNSDDYDIMEILKEKWRWTGHTAGNTRNNL